MTAYSVTFPIYYDALAALEIESKGFLDEVAVAFDDGRRYVLCFRDSWNANLENDASIVTSAGSRILALPNLVVVEVVSREKVLEAIDLLAASDFFDKLGASRP